MTSPAEVDRDQDPASVIELAGVLVSQSKFAIKLDRRRVRCPDPVRQNVWDARH
jgi:hypothetical protein